MIRPPYINHPLEVASLLANVGGIADVATLVAALLHDTVEDTSASPEELEREFGPEVRRIVAEVTDDKSLEKLERKQLQIKHTPALSIPAKQIKLGDKICNTRDVIENPPTDWDHERRLAYLDWAEKVVAGCRGANGPLERHFDQVVAEGREALACWVEAAGTTVPPGDDDARMATDPDDSRIVPAALAALPGIVAALGPKEQPAGGSWVAVTIKGRPTDQVGESTDIHRCWYTWHHDAPLEPLGEAEYMELTRDAETGVIKVPVWAFDLTPVADDEWRLGYWFAAPLRMWLGEKAGDRVKGQGLGYLARRKDGAWELELEDILAG